MLLLALLSAGALAADCEEPASRDELSQSIAGVKEQVVLLEPTAPAALDGLKAALPCADGPMLREELAGLMLAAGAHELLADGDEGAGEAYLTWAWALGGAKAWDEAYGPDVKARFEAAGAALGPPGVLDLSFPYMPGAVALDGEIIYEFGLREVAPGFHLVQWLNQEGRWEGETVVLESGQRALVGGGEPTPDEPPPEEGDDEDGGLRISDPDERPPMRLAPTAGDGALASVEGWLRGTGPSGRGQIIGVGASSEGVGPAFRADLEFGSRSGSADVYYNGSGATLQLSQAVVGAGLRWGRFRWIGAELRWAPPSESGLSWPRQLSVDVGLISPDTPVSWDLGGGLLIAGLPAVEALDLNEQGQVVDFGPTTFTPSSAFGARLHGELAYGLGPARLGARLEGVALTGARSLSVGPMISARVGRFEPLVAMDLSRMSRRGHGQAGDADYGRDTFRALTMQGGLRCSF